MNEQPNRNENYKQNKKPFFRGGWLLIFLASIGLSLILYRLSLPFGIITERYTFMVAGGVNVLIFLAILAQLLIYGRQWEAMEESTELARQTLYVSDPMS